MIPWPVSISKPTSPNVTSPHPLHRRQHPRRRGRRVKIHLRADADGLTAAAPEAAIEGYELQREIRGDLEAVVGFVASPPFGVKVMVGTGGTLVELTGDLAMGLAPLTVADAQALIASTRLGTRLDGYRNLIARTDTRPLAELVANLSLMARDLGDRITGCDLNPVMIRAGSGDVVVVDVLMTVG